MSFDVRPGAYAVIVDQGKVLLSLWRGKTHPIWTLPGGGIEWNEQPAQACVREVLEETGYHVQLGELVGTSTSSIPVEHRVRDTDRGLMIMRVVYLAQVVSGTLTAEVGGSSIDAGWVPVDRLNDLDATGGHPVSNAVHTGLQMAGYQVAVP